MRVSLLALLLLGSCATSLQRPECWSVQTPQGQGSSVPIVQHGPKLWLLTARHNLPVALAGRLKIIDAISHPTRDLALISVIGTAKYLPRIASEAPSFGERLFAAGWQNGALLMTAGYQGSDPGRMSCPIAFGASGGPVWNERGALVGINEAIWIIRNDERQVFVLQHVARYTVVVDLQDWIIENAK